LLCLSGCATRAVTECADGLNIDASLTTNHLPRKANSWLPISLANAKTPISASISSLRQKARSLPKWSFPSLPTTTSSRSFSMTRLPCALTWSRVSKLLQSLSVGSLELINRSSDGDQSSASDFSNINTKPAFSGRVFSSALAYGVNPEEHWGVL
jgi:hypothetical protein